MTEPSYIFILAMTTFGLTALAIGVSYWRTKRDQDNNKKSKLGSK